MVEACLRAGSHTIILASLPIYPCRAQVKVNSSGTYAVTCSDDNTARVWDLDTGKCIQVLQVGMGV